MSDQDPGAAGQGLRAYWPELLLLLAGIVVRFSLLDLPLDWDECNTLAIARLPLTEIFHVLAIRDIHPGASHVLMHFWIGLFGQSDVSVHAWGAFFGVLGLIGCYLLGREVGGSRRIGLLTALLTLLSPILFRYQHLATLHGMLFTVLVYSWLCFYKCLRLEGSPLRSGWAWGYALSTLTALFSVAVAPILLLFQPVLLFRRWASLSPGLRRFLIGLYAGLTLLYLPQIWVFMQPWHASRLPEMARVHNPPGLMTLLSAPANYLWLGDDQLFLKHSLAWVFFPGSLEAFPPGYWDAHFPLESFLFYILGGSVLLIWATLWQRRECPRLLGPIAAIGLAPLAVTFLLALLLQMSVFQFRAMMIAVAAVSLLAACGIDHLMAAGRKGSAGLLLALILLVQATSLLEIRALLPGNNYPDEVRTVKALRKPGDGVIIFPGYHHIGVMRYLEPREFGLTEREVHADPRRESVFHMLQRDDEDYFFVSGEDVLNQPDVSAALDAFQRRHKRIWLLGTPQWIEAHFRCDTVFLLPGPGDRPWQIRCPFASPEHCEAPLVGPDANQWQCRNLPSGAPPGR